MALQPGTDLPSDTRYTVSGGGDSWMNMCPCCDDLHCCTGAWKNDKPLPMDDYRQEAQQRELERQANSRLYDEEANTESSKAYPQAPDMAVQQNGVAAPKVPDQPPDIHPPPPYN